MCVLLVGRGQLQVCIRDGSDVPFGTASIRAVGKVAEMARIVHDRHGAKGKAVQERAEANRVALDCLYGLVTLTQTVQKLSRIHMSEPTRP